ncbi:MAG: 2Fe-2S iron-sulfur cluster-binding protein [Alphaproteobacteria bacterium]
MPTITYIQPDGQHVAVEAVTGDSVMLSAIKNNVRGIEADCGGCCSCATCHVYVDPVFAGRLTPPDENEDDLLSGTAAERRATSRLSCQIPVTPELDGMVVQIPDRQF